MQYEAIILELLTRIKTLEDEVAELKQTVSLFSERTVDEKLEHGHCRDEIKSTVSYNKLTDEMIDICYKTAKKLLSGDSIQELADDVSESTGMNRNSAIMYLYVVQNMIEGTAYKRAISARAMKKYFDNIFNEYGSNGLRNALQATRLHIEYRRECGHTVDSIEELCNRYENKL